MAFVFHGPTPVHALWILFRTCGFSMQPYTFGKAQWRTISNLLERLGFANTELPGTWAPRANPDPFTGFIEDLEAQGNGGQLAPVRRLALKVVGVPKSEGNPSLVRILHLAFNVGQLHGATALIANAPTAWLDELWEIDDFLTVDVDRVGSECVPAYLVRALAEAVQDLLGQF